MARSNADPKRVYNIHLFEHQVERIHRMAKSDIATLHNHIASHVERGEHEKAQELVKELRELQNIFAQTNVDAKLLIAESSGKPVETDVQPREASSRLL